MPPPARKGMLLMVCLLVSHQHDGALGFMSAQTTGGSGEGGVVGLLSIVVGVATPSPHHRVVRVPTNGMSANDVQERYWFCTAPANLHDTDTLAELLRFANSFAARQPVLLDMSRAGSVSVPKNAEQLRTLETHHNVRIIYFAFICNHNTAVFT